MSANNYIAPIYARADNKAIMVDPITNQMLPDSTIKGSDNGGFVKPLTRTAVTPITAATATTYPKNGILNLTHSSAQAVTLSSPIAGLDDGKELLIVSSTAQAHTVTYTPGFGGAGASRDVATFAVIGDYLRLIAINGIWFNVGSSAVFTTTAAIA
jgi:hypothetical protein